MIALPPRDSTIALIFSREPSSGARDPARMDRCRRRSVRRESAAAMSRIRVAQRSRSVASRGAVTPCCVIRLCTTFGSRGSRYCGVVTTRSNRVAARPCAPEKHELRAAATALLDPTADRFVLQPRGDDDVRPRRARARRNADSVDAAHAIRPRTTRVRPRQRVVAQSFRRDVAAQPIREPGDLRVFAGPIARDGPDARRCVPARGFVCIIAPRQHPPQSITTL